MKKRKKKIIIISIIVIILLLSILPLTRLLSQREIDDVTPEIPCEENLIEKSDVLWIIPKFENQSIANNKEWCKKILALNKTLGMHGVYHAYNEFGTDRNQNYLQEGIDIFENCFGFKPTMFKPPQMEISETNERLIKRNMQLKTKFEQVTHKVYHCSDTGIYSNKFNDWF